MKLTQLAARPQLVELVLDDAETIETYGEPVSFWTYDRQPLATFMKLAALDTTNTRDIIEVVREMILDEQGQAIIRDDNMLPTAILLRAVNRLVETLGK